MNIEDMQKIWNEGQQKMQYTIDEETLLKSVRKGRNMLRVMTNVMEIALMAISLFAGGYLLYDAIKDHEGFWAIIASFPMILVAFFILWRRSKRHRTLKRYEGTVLGDLEESIFQSSYLEHVARTFGLWFILPACIGGAINMIDDGASWQKWVLVSAAMVLSFAVTRWELVKVHQPRTKRLKALRDLMQQET